MIPGYAWIIRADIERSFDGSDTHRLYAFAYSSADSLATREYLGEDGLWHDAPTDQSRLDGVTPGWPVPRGLKQALIESLLEHADAGEVKELRAALARAEARVDRLIDKALS